MATSDVERVRLLLGEPSDAETLFTDEEVQELLTGSNNDIERATYEGWRIKAAKFANLVDVTEGNASRAMSDLYDHAMKMVAHYARASAGPTEGRTRIGQIRRR